MSPENGTCVADVVLPPQRVQRIRAFDRQTGLGVAGAVVRMVVGSSGPGNPPDATLPHVAEAQGIRMLTWPRSGVLVKTKTEADGTAVVRWVGPATEALLQCEHPQYRAATVKLPPSDEPVDVEVALDRGMRIRGVVEPVTAMQFKPEVRAVHLRDGKEVSGNWTKVDAEQRTFELTVDTASEVRLDLQLESAGVWAALAASGIARVSEGSPAGRGEEIIVLDASAYLPGSVIGRVLIDGVAPMKVRARRVRGGFASVGWVAEAVVGPDGTFVIEPMLVGEWQFAAVTKEADMRNEVVKQWPAQNLFFASCVVRASEVVRVAGDVTTIAVEMVVRDAHGTPLGDGQRVKFGLKRCPEGLVRRTLASGGVLRAGNLPSTEVIQVLVDGGALDKQLGVAEVTAKEIIVR